MMRISIKEENPLELSLRSTSLCPKKSSRYANEKQDNPITEESSNEEKSENSERSEFKKDRTPSAVEKTFNFAQPERLPSGLLEEHHEDDVAVMVDDMKMLQRKSSNRKHWLLDSGRFNRVLLNN